MNRRMTVDRSQFWDSYLSESMIHVLVDKSIPKLNAYLNSEVWMFCMAQSAGEEPGLRKWGVVVPSIDKVGRYFPLVCERNHVGGVSLSQHLKWLYVVAGLMCECIDVEWGIDVFELRLSAACSLDMSDTDEHSEHTLPTVGSRWWKANSNDFLKTYLSAFDLQESGPSPSILWNSETTIY